MFSVTACAETSTVSDSGADFQLDVHSRRRVHQQLEICLLELPEVAHLHGQRIGPWRQSKEFVLTG